MKKFACAVCAAVVAFSLLVSPAVAAGPEKPQTGIMKGNIAPDFTLKDLNGKTMKLSSMKKSVVCLVFWATWCPYCVREIPLYKQLHAKYASKGLKIITVNIGANDPIQRVAAFQKKNQLPYPVLYDAAQEVSRLYYVTGVPVSLIIDRKGVIQYRGYQLPNNAEQIIAQLL